MLDPLTALSLVSSVIQLVDFGSKLISQTQEIYHSANGATKDVVTYREVTDDIKSLYRDLAQKDDNFQRCGEDEIALGKLVDACNREAEALIDLLATLEVPEGSTRWTSFKKAIRSARKKETTEGIEKRLHKIQGQINSRLQFMLK